MEVLDYGGSEALIRPIWPTLWTCDESGKTVA